MRRRTQPAVVGDLTSARQPPRRFRPLRLLFNVLVFVGVLLALSYGILLLALRSPGFARWVSERLSHELGAPVVVRATRCTWDLELQLRGVRTEGEHPAALAHARRIRLRLDRSASVRDLRLRWKELWVEEPTLRIVETENGMREPVALTRLVGMERWQEAVRIPGTPRETGAALLPEPVSAYEPNPVRQWLPAGRAPRVYLRNLKASILDENAMAHVQVWETDIDYDPASPGEDIGSFVPRIQIEGMYQIVADRIPPQVLRLEMIEVEGEYLVLRFQAERKLFAWMDRFLSGEGAGPLTRDAAERMVPAVDLVEESPILEVPGLSPEEIARMLRSGQVPEDDEGPNPPAP